MTEAGAVSIHDAVAKTIDGETRKLDAYAGEVLLVVNVASQCGLTPQYAALEKLLKNQPGMNVEELIRLALKSL